MNLSQKLDTVIQAKDDIKEAIISKGVTPSGNITTYASAINDLNIVNNQTKTTTQNGVVRYDEGYTGLESVTVNVQPPLKSKTITSNGTYTAEDDNVYGYSSVTVNTPIGINREVSNGVYLMPTTPFTFSLPSGVTDVGGGALQYAFNGCIDLTSINLSSLTTISGNSALVTAFGRCKSLASINLSSLAIISGNYAFNNAFNGCTGLTSIDLNSLTTISGSSALRNAFGECTSLTSINLSSLTTISGDSALYEAFNGCLGLIEVDLSSLTTISSTYAFRDAFNGCRSLTSIDLSSLTTISGNYALHYAFRGCTSLTSLSFPSLTSNSFGSYTVQFNGMLSGVTGCTVHFPSNLQSVIGSWSDVISGFGGTNTTVLFDLPATT